MKTWFFDVELDPGHDPNWDGHDYVTIVALKNEGALSNFKRIVNNLTEVHSMLKPKTVGKGYTLSYKRYDNPKDVYKDFERAYFALGCMKDSLKEYSDKGYFFIAFSTQKFVYDPIQAVFETLSDMYEVDRSSADITYDDIHFILLNER